MKNHTFLPALLSKESDSLLLKLLFQSTSDIVIYLENQGNIQALSSKAKQVFQEDNTSIIGKNFLELCKKRNYNCPISPDFIAHSQSISLTQSLQNHSENPYSINWKLIPLPEISPSALLLIGKDTKINSTLSAYLNNIINHAPGSLFYWKDIKGYYLGCNEFMIKTLGLNSLADIIGKTDYELWPGTAEKISQNDQYVINFDTTVFLEETIKISDGTEIYFNGIKMPLKDETGTIIGVICNSLDVTKQKQTEHKLKHEKEKAEAANKAKDQFLANISHDIRTPLNGILGVSSLIKEGVEDPLIQDYANMLITATQSLLSLIDQIIKSVKLSTGKIPIIQQPFSLKEVLEEVIALHQATAVQKNIILKLHYDKTLPSQVIGDSLRIKLLILELVTNAIKFTHKGYVAINIQLIQPLAEKIHIKLEVKDTGIGIPTDQYQVVFSKFTRLTSAHQGIYKGMGLGLFNVNQLIKDLNADIEIKSVVGEGSTFICIIPLQSL